MATNNFIAKSGLIINKSVDKVWKALTDANLAKEYMFGATITTDWKEGSPIMWKGEWKGKKYEDKGIILQAIPNEVIKYTHYSPLSGLPDVPENYHTVTITLEAIEQNTRVSLMQDGNATEESMLHAQQNWDTMLKKLKEVAEKS